FLVDRRALAAKAVNAFASFEPEPGLKFDKIYEVYSQRFRREDLGEESGAGCQPATGTRPGCQPATGTRPGCQPATGTRQVGNLPRGPGRLATCPTTGTIPRRCPGNIWKTRSQDMHSFAFAR